MKKFNKIDFMSAFQQIELNPDCRHISSFRTHLGIFRFKRLFFGIKSAPEIFHHKIAKILEGTNSTINATDDILTMGKDDEESTKNVDEVLRRLAAHGLTVNPAKCQFNQEEVTFFGLRFNSKGVSLKEDKIKALKEFKTPTDAAELQSFLGLTVYAARWIPDLATKTEQLRQLLKSGVKWYWNIHFQTSLDEIKQSIIESVGYFDLLKKTILTTDASPVGLSAVLTQYHREKMNSEELIMCISKALTEIEKRYSQIEKEALAVVWAVERLNIYLLGNSFELRVDNKALELILRNPLSKPPARIQRWQLRLAPYDYEVIHIPGKGNIADFLSRHPSKARVEDSDDIEDYISAIIASDIPRTVTKEDILKATNEDLLMQKLIECIRRGKIHKNEGLEKYRKMFSELSVSAEGLILNGLRLVIPTTLQNQIINIAHEGHLGIVKTKRLLRSKVWFPNIDVCVEAKIQNCMACQASDKTGTPSTPVEMSKMPTQPWDKISVDFYGPIHPTKEYLLVVLDDYSRFPLVELITATSILVVRKKMEILFSIFGIPIEVRSDNGPPFNSKEFDDFAKYLGFKHRLITPEWPQANGIVESFMKNLVRIVRTAVIDKVSWKVRLIEFLRNYRSTPHSTTNVAPADLFFRNAKTTRLPQFKSNFSPNNADEYAIEADQKKKLIMKNEFDRRKNVKDIAIQINDTVLVKQKQTNKSKAPFEPHKYVVTDVKGNMVSAKRITDKKEEQRSTTRNVSFFKKWRGSVEVPEDTINISNKSIKSTHPTEVQQTKQRVIVNMLNHAKRSGELEKFQSGFETFVDMWHTRKKECNITESTLIVSDILNEIINDSCETANWNEEIKDEEAYYDALMCKVQQNTLDGSEATNLSVSLSQLVQEIEKQLDQEEDITVDSIKPNKNNAVRNQNNEQILNASSYLDKPETEQNNDLEESFGEISSNKRCLRPTNNSLNYRDNRKYDKK
jgi:transposase InsO family protein